MEHLQGLLVAIGDGQRLRIADEDAFVVVVEDFALEGDAVADVDGRAVFLFLGVLEAFGKDLQQCVKAADLCAVRCRVMRVQRAREAVDFVDALEVGCDLVDALVQAVVRQILLEREEFARADLGNRAGRRQRVRQDGRDAFQQTFLRIFVKHAVQLVERGDVDEQRGVVFAVQAIVVCVLEAGHEHAAIAHEARDGVDEAEVALEDFLLQFVVHVLEIADEADDLAVFVDRELRRADLVRHAGDDALAERAVDDAAVLDDIKLVVLERLVVDVPADFFVRLAEHGVDGREAIVVEERLARAEEAAVSVFPENLEIRMLEERRPDWRRAVALRALEQALVEVRGLEQQFQVFFEIVLVRECVAAHEQEERLAVPLIEDEAREFHPHVAAVRA